MTLCKIYSKNFTIIFVTVRKILWNFAVICEKCPKLFLNQNVSFIESFIERKELIDK